VTVLNSGLASAWARVALANVAREYPRKLDHLLGNFTAVAERHLAAGLPQATGGAYVGEHWLASFAALALGDRP